MADFTPLEKACSIYFDDTLSIRQKQELFKEVINTLPDMAFVDENDEVIFESVHDFLKKYTDIQNKYMDVFYKNEHDCVYSFEVRIADEDYTQDGRLFKNYTACENALKTLMNGIKGLLDAEGDLIYVMIKKHWINDDDDEYPKYISVVVDCNNNPVDLGIGCAVMSMEECDLLYAFELLNFNKHIFV